ncbi:TIM barrel protein [Pleomorphochaeta sp. DL1XJH-081]|uniref:TIM barrel protein n=1 Tax=Pleomorphochaeta sp. DL1XJH-081 TaxID=3409690 RepID=UPI003BB62C71
MRDIGVCIEPFYQGMAFGQKLEKIKALGFTSYEFWFHDKIFTGDTLIDEMKDFSKIAELNASLGLRTNDFVLNHPDGGIIAALINRNEKQKILDKLKYMIDLAHQIGCKKFISGSGNKITGLSQKNAIDAMIDALGDIGEVCQKHGMEIILEPFNSRVDHPDYFLDNPQVAVDVVKAVGNDHVKILYDIYHMQIMYGNILDFVRSKLTYIGHFHIAGVPGRHEPIHNELNYPFILDSIDAMGYQGSYGLEYWPTMDSDESLKKTMEHLAQGIKR